MKSFFVQIDQKNPEEENSTYSFALEARGALEHRANLEKIKLEVQNDDVFVPAGI